MSAALPETVALAERHGVSGVIGQAERGAVLAGLARVADLVRIARLTEGQAVLALKGPVLSQQLWGEPTRRSFVDLDLLTPIDQVESVAGLLEAELRAERLQGSLAQLRHFEHQMQLRTSSGTLLELHWAWAEPHLLVAASTEACLRDAVHIELGGAVVPTLGPAHTLLYLAVHGARHGWSRLDLVCDMARALLKFPEARAEAALIARAWRVQRTFEVACEVVQQQFKLPVGTTDARNEALANAYVRALGTGQPVDAFALFMAGRDSRADALRMLVRRARSAWFRRRAGH